MPFPQRRETGRMWLAMADSAAGMEYPLFVWLISTQVLRLLNKKEVYGFLNFVILEFSIPQQLTHDCCAGQAEANLKIIISPSNGTSPVILRCTCGP